MVQWVVELFGISGRINWNPHVLTDQEIRLVGNTAKGYEDMRLRRVLIWDDKNECEIELLTNHMEFASSTISTHCSFCDGCTTCPKRSGHSLSSAS